MPPAPEADPSKTLVLSKSRVESFSDGVFAVAITLLVLEIRLPAWATASSSQAQQVHALLVIWPQYLVYAASFLTIGIMWVNHHALFDNARRITHRTIMANLTLLGLITFLPFTTDVLQRMDVSRASVVYYGLTLTAISLAYVWVYFELRAAHGIVTRMARWNIGLALYPFGTLCGYFVPLLGVVLFLLLGIYYAMPQNIRTATLALDAP